MQITREGDVSVVCPEDSIESNAAAFEAEPSDA